MKARPLTHVDILIMLFLILRLTKQECEDVHNAVKTSNGLGKMEDFQPASIRAFKKVLGEAWLPFLMLHHGMTESHIETTLKKRERIGIDNDDRLFMI